MGVFMKVIFLLTGICKLCQGPKWWRPLKGPVITQKPDSSGRCRSHIFLEGRESERKLRVNNSGHMVWLKERRNLPFLHTRWRVWKKELEVSVGRRKLDTVLILFNAMQFNAMKTKFHNRGSAFVAVVLWLSSEKDLNLVYYFMPI